MVRGHHPCGDHNKSGFKKLRRLHRGKAEAIPAHRALAEISAQEGQHHQRRESHQKTQNRQTAHQIGIHHRGDEHRHHRHAAKNRLPLHIMEMVEPVFRSQGRRGRQPEQNPDTEQCQNARHRPFIDGAPPFGENRLDIPNGNRAIDHFCHGIPPNTASNSRPCFQGPPCPFAGSGGKCSAKNRMVLVFMAPARQGNAPYLLPIGAPRGT